MVQTLQERPRKISKWIILAASIIGMLDAGYLTFIKLTKIPIYCTPGLGDCDVVNASRWSELWGIPIAAYGFATYLAIFLIITLADRFKATRAYADLMLFDVSLMGFLYSVYLNIIGLTILKTFCQWCVVSFTMITTIFIVSIFRLVVKSAVQK